MKPCNGHALSASFIPFTLAELNARLHTLVAFGIDILVVHNRKSMRLWKHGQGYDSDGLDFVISLRAEHYVRQQRERTLNKGDRVAVLGRGIAVVEKACDREVVLVLGKSELLRIARNEIAFNQRNMRWECGQIPILCSPKKK